MEVEGGRIPPDIFNEITIAFEGSRIWLDILNEISIVLTTIFPLNNCDNCKLSY